MTDITIFRFIHRHRRATLGVLATLVAGFAAAATAGDLPDPTRPPAAQRRVGIAGPQAAALPAAPVLQSILTGEGRKPSVIINGRALELGEAFDDMRLTRVTATGALLSGPHGLTALVLTPDADKQVAKAATAAPEAVALTRPSSATRRAAATALAVGIAEQK